MIPDREACLQLLEEVGCGQAVIEHVQAVAQLALQLAGHAQRADERLLEAGALLHDIGRAVDHGPDHVVEGVRLLRERDIDPQVQRIVARHMGAGISDEQARAFGWPEDPGYMPETLEERLVCHADNLTFGTRYVGLEEVLDKLTAQGLGEDVVDRMQVLHEGLAEDLGIDPAQVAAEL